jgi:3-isopropylmalate/(R)-2-methylmalate dehydratase large subunit
LTLPPSTIRITPGKRVLFLTKDPEKIRAQLDRKLVLRTSDVKVDDLLDDVNTDAMTPGWVCFDHLPAEIAKNAYAGLVVKGKRLFGERELLDGGFEVIVSGRRKGTGSSRETAVQAEKWSGIRIAIAESFAPIHARNNVNQGVLMGDHAMLARLEKGEAIPLSEFTAKWDPITRLVIEHGGLFPFNQALARGEVKLPARTVSKRPMTMGEKVLAAHLLPGQGAPYVKPGDSVMVNVDGGYSHEYTTAQVHTFLEEEYGKDYRIKDPERFAVFEDHLIYAEYLPSMGPFQKKIDTLRQLQRDFQRHTGVRDFSAVNGRSPGICHEVARQKMIAPGDFIQATDSHTCMGGGNDALAWGVGATEYAALVAAGFTFVTVPESIRFELSGSLAPNVTAKDVMLHILLHYAKEQKTLDRIMEFGGPGLRSLSIDERATLANMATECSAKAGICEGDEDLVRWLAERRPDLGADRIRSRLVAPDPGAVYDGGVHRIDLGAIRPMVATPGDPDRGIPSDPTNGALIEELEPVRIDIAYGGSCTAGKEADQDMYAAVLRDAAAAGRKVANGTTFFIQFGAEEVEAYAKKKGYFDLYEKTGVKVISSGCGACIGCGPGVSERADQVSVSAINRNYRGRSGPGKLYLASPLTVAASAIEGRIVAYRQGMFASR